MLRSAEKSSAPFPLSPVPPPHLCSFYAFCLTCLLILFFVLFLTEESFSFECLLLVQQSFLEVGTGIYPLPPARKDMPEESWTSCPRVGIVQKVFTEKASGITRMRQKCVRNASKIHQNGSCLIGKRRTFQSASEIRQKCAEHLWGRTPFGRYRSSTRTLLEVRVP